MDTDEELEAFPTEAGDVARKLLPEESTPLFNHFQPEYQQSHKDIELQAVLDKLPFEISLDHLLITE